MLEVAWAACGWMLSVDDERNAINPKECSLEAAAASDGLPIFVVKLEGSTVG